MGFLERILGYSRLKENLVRRVIEDNIGEYPYIDICPI